MENNDVVCAAFFATFLGAVFYASIQALYDGIRRGYQGTHYRPKLFLHPIFIVGANWLLGWCCVATVPARYNIRIDIFVIPVMCLIAALVAFLVSRSFRRNKAEAGSDNDTR